MRRVSEVASHLTGVYDGSFEVCPIWFDKQHLSLYLSLSELALEVGAIFEPLCKSENSYHLAPDVLLAVLVDSLVHSS